MSFVSFLSFPSILLLLSLLPIINAALPVQGSVGCKWAYPRSYQINSSTGNYIQNVREFFEDEAEDMNLPLVGAIYHGGENRPNHQCYYNATTSINVPHEPSSEAPDPEAGCPTLVTAPGPNTVQKILDCVQTFQNNGFTFHYYSGTGQPGGDCVYRYRIPPQPYRIQTCLYDDKGKTTSGAPCPDLAISNKIISHPPGYYSTCPGYIILKTTSQYRDQPWYQKLGYGSGGPSSSDVSHTDCIYSILDGFTSSIRCTYDRQGLFVSSDFKPSFHYDSKCPSTAYIGICTYPLGS